MPGYKTHLASGVVVFTLLLSLPFFFTKTFTTIDTRHAFWYLCCALAGSLFPDVDVKSKGQKLFYRIGLILVLGAIITKDWLFLSLISLALLLPILVRHRGITHHLWFIVCVPFVVPIIASSAFPHLLKPALFGYFFFIGGAVAHLMLDFGPSLFVSRLLFKTKAHSKRRK